MIITPRQIRAARDMLLMSQGKLAEVAGVSTRTLIKAESEPEPNQSEFISYESLGKIRKALEDRDIEFLGTRGVTLRETSQSKAFEGPDSPNIFYQDILAAAQNNDEILAVYDTTETLARSLGVVNFNNLGKLEEISRHAKVKCLLTNPENSSLFLPFFQVRVMPKFPFGYQARIFCGNLHATIQTVDGKNFSYYESSSLDITLKGKIHFSSAWSSSLPLAEMAPLKKKARA